MLPCAPKLHGLRAVPTVLPVPAAVMMCCSAERYLLAARGVDPARHVRAECLHCGVRAIAVPQLDDLPALLAAVDSRAAHSAATAGATVCYEKCQSTLEITSHLGVQLYLRF